MTIKIIVEWLFYEFLDSLDILDEEAKNTVDYRLLFYANCSVRTDKSCDSKTFIKNGTRFQGCGCNVEAKVLCKNCECPAGNW